MSSAFRRPAHGGEGERLRGTGVLAVPERGDQLAGRERGVVEQASAAPPIGVVGVESGRGGGVGEREERRDLGAGRDSVRVLLVAHVARREHGAQHHRPLTQAASTRARSVRAGRLRPLVPVPTRRGAGRAVRASIPTPRTGSTSTPGARGSRRARCPSVRAGSSTLSQCAIDRVEQVVGARPGSSESRWRTVLVTSASTRAIAASSACLPDAATAAMASGCTNAADPSSSSSASTSSSNRVLREGASPAHAARPMRWPSRREKANTSRCPRHPAPRTRRRWRRRAGVR